MEDTTVNTRPSLGLVLASLLLTVSFAWMVWQSSSRRKEEREFALRHGCDALPSWNAQWPLGIDLLLKAVSHVKKGTILSFFVEVGDSNPLTHAQNLLFDTGIGTSDAQNVAAILSSQFEDFDLGLRQVQFKDIFGTGGIISQDGAPWKHSRSMLRPLFGSNRFQIFEEIRKSVEQHLDRVPSHAPVDLQPLFFQVTLDTTLFLLFGNIAESVRASGVVDRQAEFARAFNDGQEYLTYRVRLGGLYWLYDTRQYRKTCGVIRRFVDDIVEQALVDAHRRGKNVSDEDTPFVLLDAMLEQTKDKNVLRDQCLSFLLAGRDSTACALSWSIYLLVRHPDSLQKLREEVSATVGLNESSRLPSQADIKTMPYLQNIIKEVLRLYPPLPVNVRAATRMTTLPTGGGPQGTSPILVRKGQPVTWAAYLMHRREAVFGADARSFKPERWEDPALKDLGYAYIPFNGGKRSCLGQDFAVLEVGYTIVRLLQRFPNIKLPPDHPVYELGREKQLMTLVLSPAEGTWVQT